MTAVPGIQVLLPLKPPGMAKSRLAGVLDAAQRCGLARAMAQDVIAQLGAHAQVARINLLSDDPDAAVIAGATKVRLIAEQTLLLHSGPPHADACSSDRPRPDRSRPDRSRPDGSPPDRSRPDHSLNAVLTAACRQLAQEPAADDGLVLVLHADLPLLTRADIDAAVACYRAQPGVVLATDTGGTGTNLLMFSQAIKPRFCFGAGSRGAHVNWAQEQGVPVQVLCRPGLALDIDTADDLDHLLQMTPASVGECTRQWLVAAGLARQSRPDTSTFRNAR